MRALLSTSAVRIESWLSQDDERCLANDVLDGLTRPFKEIPPKHFYDARGSQLFAEICEQPEYYPTRVEREILQARAAEVVKRTGAGELVELGSGSAEKARLLLDAIAACGQLRCYVPLDVSAQVVEDSALELIEEYPGLRVHGVIGDFERHLDRLPQRPPGARRLVALLGGTIGNFPPGSRRRLLRQIAAVLEDGDWLLLGTDLVKHPAVLEAAYNDARGVTAEFNRNVLAVINRELDADFPLQDFEHVAFFDRRQEWIEMRLRARRACSVRIGALALQVQFAAGEELRTEISAKFTLRRIDQDLAAAGLERERFYTDGGRRFGLTLARRAA